MPHHILRSLASLTLCALAAACAPEPTPSSEEASAETAAVAETAPPEAPPPPVDVAAVAARLQHGIDLSSHNGSVDWAAVAAEGHTFAFVKATEGVDDKDPTFDSHWPAMKAAGLIRGAYHFYVTEDDPEEQARFFLDAVTLEPGDLAPVVDIELIGHDTPPGLADRLKTFLEIVEGRYGVKAIIYTDLNFWNEHLDERFGDHPLWIAEYGVSEPHVPVGWKTWHLWQYRDDDPVPGVEKTADISHVNRSGIDLTALIIPG